jgi:hypothetical protein
VGVCDPTATTQAASAAAAAGRANMRVIEMIMAPFDSVTAR